MLRKLLTATLGCMAAFTLCGCSGNDAGTDTTKNGKDSAQHEHDGEDAHVHPVEGPRGGHLIELGDEAYHAEFLHDEAKHAVTVHILDAKGKQDVQIDQPEILLQIFKDGQFVTHSLKAVAGASPSSEFTLVDEDLCSLLHDEDLRGRLQVTIQGEPYTGVLAHHAGDHDEHDHAKKGEQAENHKEH